MTDQLDGHLSGPQRRPRSDDELEARLRDLVASCVPDREVSRSLQPEMTLRRDLGLDSVKLAMLLFKFEEEFGIEMPDTALARGPMTSLGELIQEVMRALQGHDAGDGDRRATASP